MDGCVRAPQLSRGVSWTRGEGLSKLQGTSKSVDSVSVIVIVSVAVSFVSGLMFVSTMLSHLLPDGVASTAGDVTLWLLHHLPRVIFDTMIQLSFWVSLAGLVVDCSTSLIAGLRASREGGSKRRSIALMASGGVLATILCVGPLGAYAYERATLDGLATLVKEGREQIRTRLEAGKIPAAHRERLWRLYASEVYGSEGVVVDIPNEQGKMVAYQPTDAEVATRKWYVENINQMRPPNTQIGWSIAVVAISVGLGLLTPILKKPPLHSSGAS